MIRVCLTFHFLQIWDEAFCFPKFFTKKQTFLYFFGPYYHYSSFFWIKNDAPWNSASIGPNESPWTPVFDHFVQFLIMSVPKQPGLILKSAVYLVWGSISFLGSMLFPNEFIVCFVCVVECCSDWFGSCFWIFNDCCAFFILILC